MKQVMMAGAVAVGMAALGKWLTGASRAEAAPGPTIRDAGPDCMSDPPDDWDITDQTSDESFPASDPPGGY